MRLKLLGVCQAAVVGPVLVSVSHNGTGTSTHTHTPTQPRVDRLVGELAAGKLFVVGCDGQGLGMCLEPQGVCLPHPAAPIRNGAREILNPCIDMWKQLAQLQRTS